ncbi:MAG TPA: RNA polymerase sigma factor [Kofleriaceae bacterium]|nr:RNA polymerase sigma factor [Kofleriaceae bacterium]
MGGDDATNLEAIALMQMYCDGDANAFRQLYALIAPRVHGYLLRMVRERAAADDLVQLTFLKVHRARAAYVRGADPVPWIFAIAHRTFLDDVRGKQRARVRVTDDGETPEAVADITGAADGAGIEGDGTKELTAATLAALQMLPPAQREAVVLTKLSGKSIAEAAEIAGTTPGAMKVRVHRGYEALRKALGARTGTEESP